VARKNNEFRKCVIEGADGSCKRDPDAPLMRPGHILAP
jgi:hypothetical protein